MNTVALGVKKNLYYFQKAPLLSLLRCRHCNFRREETQVSPQRNPREQEAQYVREQEEGQRRSSWPFSCGRSVGAWGCYSGGLTKVHIRKSRNRRGKWRGRGGGGARNQIKLKVDSDNNCLYWMENKLFFILYFLLNALDIFENSGIENGFQLGIKIYWQRETRGQLARLNGGVGSPSSFVPEVRPHSA